MSSPRRHLNKNWIVKDGLRIADNFLNSVHDNLSQDNIILTFWLKHYNYFINYNNTFHSPVPILLVHSESSPELLLCASHQIFFIKLPAAKVQCLIVNLFIFHDIRYVKYKLNTN